MKGQNRFSVKLNESGNYVLEVATIKGPVRIAKCFDGCDGFARELSVLFDRHVDVEIEHCIMKSCLEDTIQYLQETGNRGLSDAIYRMQSALELVESERRDDGE